MFSDFRKEKKRKKQRKNSEAKKSNKDVVLLPPCVFTRESLEETRKTGFEETVKKEEKLKKNVRKIDAKNGKSLCLYVF